MTDLGVTDEQFLAACEKASKNPMHKKIVDQITAVDNFVAFKRLMNKRNTELNNQAAAVDKIAPLQQQQPKVAQGKQSDEAMKEALRVA